MSFLLFFYLSFFKKASLGLGSGLFPFFIQGPN